MPTYPVKHHFHTDTGAPTMSAYVPGSLIEVLEACLVTGYNLQNVTGITMEDATTAKVSFGSVPGFRLNQIILIEGADQAAYNGEHKVVDLQGNDAYVEMDSDPASDATGTMTAKVAPTGGWETAFIDGNRQRAAFRSTDPESTGYYLYIDNRDPDSLEVPAPQDTTGSDGRSVAYARGCRTMGGLDVREDEFGDGFFMIGSNYSSYDRDSVFWEFVADSRMFYININGVDYSSYDYSSVHVFGDIVSYRPGDKHHCILCLCPADNSDIEDSYGYSAWGLMTSSDCKKMARGYSQFPGQVDFKNIGLCDLKDASNSMSPADWSIGRSGFTFPNPVDNSMLLSRLRVLEGEHLRGIIPGALQPLHHAPLAHKGTYYKDGRLYLGLSHITAHDSSYPGLEGQTIFDITGPWR